MGLRDEIAENVEGFKSLCSFHHVHTLHVFGSPVRDDFKEDSSDIDLLVEMNESHPVFRGERLMSLWDGFERFLKRKVNLLADASMQNPVLRRSVEKGKVPIYDGIRGQILV